MPEEYNQYLINMEKEFEFYIFEKYKKNKIKARNLFYVIKPIIPRFLQIFLRRIKAEFRNDFPKWPIESYLEDFKIKSIRNMSDISKIPFIWFWPDNKNFAVVLTHDVETKDGLKNISKICSIEKRFGLNSTWFFVPEKYPIPESLIEELSEQQFEIGIHGLKHDGKLFWSRKIFGARIEKIKIYKTKWNAKGFRSPSLLRNPAWMKQLPFEYDSSLPDTDPFGPQPGGCLSLFPYFLGNLIELPITLPQDHTLFEILKLEDITIWMKKIDLIEKMNGMALLITHPDYVNSKRLKLYEKFLEYILKKNRCWFALARDVNDWWRKRDVSTIKMENNNLYIDGPCGTQGKLRLLKEVVGKE